MWLWVILIGFVIGLIARLIMPGPQPGGFIITTLLGIGGSLLATWLGQQLGVYQPGESAGFIGSVVGAIVVLAIYQALRRPAAGPPGRRW